MFKYSLDNKRYHTLNYFFKNKFNSKVYKVSLNGGFTCPNIDGTKGYGGCIYCSRTGSGEHGGNPSKSLTEQFYDVKKVVDNKSANYYSRQIKMWIGAMLYFLTLLFIIRKIADLLSK